MAVHIVRLGSKRLQKEGLRIGTVRRPPRGVPKSRYAADDWYDIWLPDLAPAQETVTRWLKAQTDREWQAFARPLPDRDAQPRSKPPARSARGAVTADEFLRGLLLRG